ncbi:MAG: ABC transporter substrate-binding protein [Acidimicrobiia bacterium]
MSVTVLMLLVGSCSESSKKEVTSVTKTPSSCSTKDLLACARKSILKQYVPSKPTKATGAPIHLGMINQENTPAGSYPELSQAVMAATKFINEELGGVHGRPIEVDVCNTQFSAEGSTACGQKYVEAKVPAVLGGIDVFGNGIDTLDENGIPFVGGIPISAQSVTNANSFQWSGGSGGAAVSFSWYAAEKLHAKKVAIVYGEFGSITDAAEMGKKVLEDAGVQVQMVPYPILATDISSALNAAATFQPDAIFVMATDAGCKAGFDGVASLGIKAATFYVGACAAPSIIAQAGTAKTEGAYFNVESSLSTTPPDPDYVLYNTVVEKYGDGLDPIGAGTVSFKSMMNLYLVLNEVGSDITPASILAALKAKVDAPSFAGHEYTCDGKQFDGLPAMCSPQQVLGQMHDSKLTAVTGWVDVGTIFHG